MWWDSIFLSYQEAYEKFQESHPGAAPRLWELEFSVDEESLRNAASNVVQEILHKGIAENPKATALFLRYILRTRLSRVRGNYLWPEVGNFLTQMSSQLLFQPRLQRYFRESLQHVHGNELPDRKNRYVMFLIEDTGAGLARSYLVKDFLLRVVRDYEDQWNKKSRQEYIAEMLEEVQQDDDLAILSGVLGSTAHTLLEMVDFRYEKDVPQRITQNWDAARNFWYEAIGTDINRLMPEARETLGDVVAQVNHRALRVSQSYQKESSSTLLLFQNKRIRPGVVVVHYASERIEVRTTGSAPTASPGVRIQPRTVGGTLRYRLNKWPADRSAWVRVGGMEWTVINVSSFNVTMPDNVKWDDIRVIGHHCAVMQRQHANTIKVSYPDDFEGSIYLRVSPCDDNTNIIPVMNNQSVDINQWFSGTGPFSVEVLFHDTPLGLSRHGYLFDESPRKRPALVGQKAVLEWQEGSKYLRSVASMGPIEMSTVLEKKYVFGRYSPNEEWTLECQWKPLISDVLMKLDDRRVASEFEPFWAGDIQHSVSLEVMGDTSDIQIYVGSIRCHHLSQFQDTLSMMLNQANDVIPIIVQGEDWRKTWTANGGAGAIEATVEWDKTNMPLAFIQWTHVSSEVPLVSILGDTGTWNAVEDLGPIGPLGFHRFRTTMHWHIPLNERKWTQMLSVDAWVRGNWTQVALLAPPPLKDANEIREIIKTSLETSNDAHDAWDIVYLNERYARGSGRIAVSVDKQERILSNMNDGTVTEVIYTLKLLEKLLKGQPSPRHNIDTVTGIDIYSRIFYLSLLAINQQQLLSKGLGDRRVCRELINALQEYFHDEKVGNWCCLIAQYCAELAGIIDSNWHIPDSRPQDPVILCDRALRDWLDQTYDEEGN